jgi:hypothetical protein
MIESPVLQRFLREQLAERMHRAILGVLEKRFGPVPPEVTSSLRAITDDDRLQQLIELGGVGPDLEGFRQQLAT